MSLRSWATHKNVVALGQKATGGGGFFWRAFSNRVRQLRTRAYLHLIQ